MSTAPDLPGVVIGWRSWRVVDGPLLGSLAHAARWPARAAMIARCDRCGDERLPSPRCRCGLYAVHDLAEVPAASVVGCVALWGNVVQGREGWRASRGYPSLLFADPSVDERTRALLAERYGIAAHAVPEPWSSLLAIGGRQLSFPARMLRQRTSALGRPWPTGDAVTGDVDALLDEIRLVAPRAHRQTR